MLRLRYFSARGFCRCVHWSYDSSNVRGLQVKKESACTVSSRRRKVNVLSYELCQYFRYCAFKGDSEQTCVSYSENISIKLQYYLSNLSIAITIIMIKALRGDANTARWL